jgi:hypothetical protein
MDGWLLPGFTPWQIDIKEVGDTKSKITHNRKARVPSVLQLAVENITRCGLENTHKTEYKLLRYP